MHGCLWINKPSQYVTKHLGRLSLLLSVWWWNEYQLLSWVVVNGDGDCRLGIISISRYRDIDHQPHIATISWDRLCYDIVRMPPDLFLWMAIADRCMKVDGLDACPCSTVATDCAARGRGWQSGRPPSTLMRNWIQCLCGSQALSRCCWISRGLTVCRSHQEWLCVLLALCHRCCFSPSLRSLSLVMQQQQLSQQPLSKVS